MNALSFTALDSEIVAHYRNGGLDAHGNAPETLISEGGAPCRYCLDDIAPGESMLLVAHRPFPQDQPYAETGPIFIHRAACTRYEGSAVPPFIRRRKEMVVRGYDSNDRMVYSTASRVPLPQFEERAVILLRHPDVVYLHVRGTVTTCFQCRIDSVSS